MCTFMYMYSLSKREKRRKKKRDKKERGFLYHLLWNGKTILLCFVSLGNELHVAQWKIHLKSNRDVDGSNRTWHLAQTSFCKTITCICRSPPRCKECLICLRATLGIAGSIAEYWTLSDVKEVSIIIIVTIIMIDTSYIRYLQICQNWNCKLITNHNSLQNYINSINIILHVLSDKLFYFRLNIFICDQMAGEFVSHAKLAYLCN